MKYAKLCIIFVGILAVFGGYIAWKISTVPVIAVHYHANFLVYKDGAIQDYSDNKYMELTPCALNEKHDFFEKEERFDLHSNIGTVVHVHSPGVKWSELLSFLGIDASKATYMKNGSFVPRAEQQVIQADDRMLIIVGSVPKDVDVLYAHTPSDAPEYNEGKKGTESCSSGPDETYSLWQRLRIAFGI